MGSVAKYIFFFSNYRILFSNLETGLQVSPMQGVGMDYARIQYAFGVLTLTPLMGA